MTRSKAPLAMMEQMVMLLVFALAAALCLQAFVKSDGMSKRGEARDRAVVLAQNAAEAVRACGGDFEEAAQLLGAEDWDEESITLNYNSGWSLLPPAGAGCTICWASGGWMTAVCPVWARPWCMSRI